MQRKDRTLALVIWYINPLFAYIYVGRFKRGLLIFSPLGLILLFFLLVLRFENLIIWINWIYAICAISGLAGVIYSFLDVLNIVDQINFGIDQALDKNRIRNERGVSGGNDEPPPVPPGGFQRKVKGEVKYKPLDPIE